MSKCFWVEGMIADWGPKYDDAYLIERVRRSEVGGVYVNFRNINSWEFFPDDPRGWTWRDRDGEVTVREPTDQELALIAKNRLIGVNDEET